MLSTYLDFITLFSSVSEFFLMTEQKQKSLMRNHTITTFILLGLIDDPQMKVLAFIFLFFNLHVECSWESDYYLPHPHRWPSQDSHVLVSPKFLFLGNLIHSCLYSQISVNITTADKVIIYTACAVQVFFTFLFWDNGFFSSSHYVL